MSGKNKVCIAQYGGSMVVLSIFIFRALHIALGLPLLEGVHLCCAVEPLSALKRDG